MREYETTSLYSFKSNKLVQDMGIKGYRKWISNAFPDAFINVQPDTRANAVDYVYVDLNGYFHVLGRRAKDEGDLISKIYKKLRRMISNLAIPQKGLYLAMDGPAPTGKLWTQRIRREAEFIKNPGKSSSSLSVMLTPGTQFFRRSTEYLSYFACDYLLRYPRPGMEVIVSCANVPGEGEHKLMKHLLRRYEASKLKSSDDKGYSLVIGSDADLILMLISCGVRNSLCCSEWQSANEKLKCFSYNHFITTLKKKFKCSDDNEAHRIRMDFVAISLFLGNDYLPKLAGSSMDLLWNSYVDIKRKGQKSYLWDTDREQLNLKMLSILLQSAIKRTPNSTLKQLDRRHQEKKEVKLPSRDSLRVFNEDETDIDSEHDSEDADDLQQLEEEEDEDLEDILAKLSTSDDKLLSRFLAPQVKKAVIPSNPSLYLKGISWIMKLFKSGNYEPWNFEYSPRRSVSITELYDHIEKNKTGNSHIADNQSSFFNPAVIPALLIPDVPSNGHLHDETTKRIFDAFQVKFTKLLNLQDVNDSSPLFHSAFAQVDKKIYQEVSIGKIITFKTKWGKDKTGSKYLKPDPSGMQLPHPSLTSFKEPKLLEKYKSHNIVKYPNAWNSPSYVNGAFIHKVSNFNVCPIDMLNLNNPFQPKAIVKKK